VQRPAAVIGLSNAPGIEATVKGVVGFDQLDLVISKRVPSFQGWIYSKR
jgi:EAL domain-containing protein (putative c-di-GMP-specific phosphodiesterase class I)